MSVESWDPSAAQQAGSYQLKHEFLLNLIEQHTRQSQDTPQVREYFQQGELQMHSAMMTLAADAWLQVIGDFSEPQLLSLIEILTLAETQIPGFEAGADSPVIVIVKYLKQQKTPLSREMLLWIRANTNNRFLPNGPL
ncbi:MAG: hypothetical protein OIF38_08910 [Cellvibrionaceae bacterium]|nr:hypothetical protein [Cellvibrionaceae bacterium]